MAALIEYVDKQDKKIINRLNQHIEESNRTNENMKEWMKSIDGKLDDLLNREK